MNKPFENKQRENDEFRDKTLNWDDDKVVFVPFEEIKAIESIYNKMEQAQREFCKVAEELRNNYKWEC